MMSKKQPPVQYISSQAEHNLLAQREQIEASVKELELRLDMRQKNMGREKE
jgi:hypothetical protein